MASKRLAFKNVKECKYSSISKHNAALGSNYLFFNPKNITDFTCVKGEIGGITLYINEVLKIMWSNEEIYEYVFLAKEKTPNLDLTSFGEVHSAIVLNHKIDYTFKKGCFRRRYYNVVFEEKGTTYYLFIKTSKPNKFKQLIGEFFEQYNY